MSDQNNAPERIKALVDKLRAEASRGPLTSREIFALTDPIMDTLARADRAAPEGQSYFGPMGIPHWSSALTPPPAAPEGQVRALPRAVGDDQNAGWTLPTDDLAAIKDQAYKKWGEVVSLETVEAIALEVERSILTALTPPPAAPTDILPSGMTKEEHRIKVIAANERLIADNIRLKAKLSAPTDNTALVADRPIDTSRKEIDTCLFRGSPGWHNRLLRAVADERDVARAEIERLKRELEITHNSRNELAETWKDRAIKAEAERDALMADPLYIIGVNHGWDEAVENDAAHPAARPIQSMLADAERDMRQRAADLFADANHGEHIKSAILALPLKHADREGVV